MKNLTRRFFVTRAAAASTTILSLFTTTTRASESQLVWRASQWNLAEFHKLLRDPAKIKQVHDVVPIADGTFLNGMKNSLNALQFGFGFPKEQVKIVGALHGPANMVNYDDYVWNRYEIGEWLNVIDPVTESQP